MIGIIGAMPEEIDVLTKSMDTRVAQQRGPFTLHVGRLENKGVLVAQCGIGKVNAAALTQMLLHQGVTQIIFTGVAGGLAPSLNVGDIVVSTDCVQHDVDASNFGYAPGQIPSEDLAWQADETLQDLALSAAQTLDDINIISGRILSGDQFIQDPQKVAWLRETFNGACAEMEGAAVAQVCHKWDVPFVIIRSISDTGDDDATVDFQTFMPLAAERAARVVKGVLQKL